MKAIISLMISFFLGSAIFAQIPEKMSYQSVVRNSTGNLVVNQAVGMKFSLLQGSPSGTAVYVETHKPSTNALGLISLEIGGGTVISGNFSQINWSKGPFYLKTETDPAGGTTYTIVGTTQLLSVPYSLYAKSASLSFSKTGDTLYSGSNYLIVPGVSEANNSGTVPAGAPQVTTSLVTAVTETTAQMGGNVTVAGSSVVTARGVCYATTGSPTTANNSVAAGTGIGAFNVTLSSLAPGTTYYARAYAINASGTSYGGQVSFTTTGTVSEACAEGTSLTVTHIAGAVAPVSKTVTYKLVRTSLTGEPRCWIAQNLGSDRQAVTYDDNTETSAGWYWQFNRKLGYKHDGLNRTPNVSWLTGISENSNWTPANDPCTLLLGNGWRLPTNIEWQAVANNVQLTATAANNKAVLAFNSVIRIHKAGYLTASGGSLANRGLAGIYWTSRQDNADHSWYVDVSDGYFGTYAQFSKAGANAVRCLK